MTELKLFVWDKFNPSYSPGLAFAIAETEEEAMGLILKQHGTIYGEFGEVKILPIAKCAFSVNGEE